jgi:hypothetical protein
MASLPRLCYMPLHASEQALSYVPLCYDFPRLASLFSFSADSFTQVLSFFLFFFFFFFFFFASYYS